MLTDERQRHIEEFGVPVDCFRPANAWVVVLDRESQDVPTDQELLQIKSFAEFSVRRKYSDRTAFRIIQISPFRHLYGDSATIVFIKGWGRSGDGWHYRYSQWSQGPLYVPLSTEPGFRSHALVEVMDLCENLFPEHWARWKQGHPDIFGV